jgi:methionine-gamma-lyase
MMIHDYEKQLADRAAALATRAIHAGEDPEELALESPIVLANAFRLGSADEAAAAFRGDSDAPVYGRWGNPTVDRLEALIAALEEAQACAVTASGMAAITGTILSLCESGAHVVAPQAMYGESARLLRERLPKLGITTTFVQGDYASAIRPETRVLYVETPANPTLAITDIAAVVALARSSAGTQRTIRVVCDNTFATPFAQSPLTFGVDVVIHSMTKALGGHGDVVAGAACGKKEIVDRIRELAVRGLGAPLAPLGAYLVARGARTFPLRMRQSCSTAAKLARKLEAHPRVAKVHHPSLPSHPGHEKAREQMHAFGSLVAFELESLEHGKRFVSALEIISHAVSLGDVRSLLSHPASTTHASMPAADRARAGVSDGLLRLSVGIEGEDDLWRDLENALEKI